MDISLNNGLDVVQMWQLYDCNMPAYRLNIGHERNVAEIWLGCGCDVAVMWLRCG
jgi:hypothetical protein